MLKLTPEIVRSPDDAAGGGTDGTGTDDTAMSTPAMQEAIKKAVADATAGLAKNRDTLLAEAKKAKSDLAKLFGDLGGEAGVTKLRELREKIDKDEDMKLVEDGEIDTLIDRRTARLKMEHDAQLKARDEAIRSSEEKYGAVQKRLELEIIGNAVHAAANALDVKRRPNGDAMRHLVRDAMGVFRLEENGRPTAFDENDQPLYGKDAKPLSVGEWMEMQREVSPSFFPTDTTGMGMRILAGGKLTADLSKMTPAQRMQFARKHELK